MEVKRPRSYKSELRSAAAEQTRARIIAAARELLGGGKDLPACSLDSVAKQAGITRLTVYNQFGSKMGLLESVFDDFAQRGGLTTDLPSVFAEKNPRVALRRFVSVFCRFWRIHEKMLPRLQALAKLDDDIAQSLKQRIERRRQGLAMLVGRLKPSANAPPMSDLVDVLFALTSFETHAALSVRNRSAKAIEMLVYGLVERSVTAFDGNG